VQGAVQPFPPSSQSPVTYGRRKSALVLGVGEAHVWNPVSVERTPAFLVAAYAAVLLAQMQAFGDRRTEAFEPLPAWRKDHPLRPSLRDLVALLRKEAGEYIAQQKRADAA